MNEKQQNPTENNETMGKIMLKMLALGVGCIAAAWGIVKILEKF